MSANSNDNEGQAEVQNQPQVQLMEAPLGDVEIINGVACPIDPQERLLCESCQ